MKRDKDTGRGQEPNGNMNREKIMEKNQGNFGDFSKDIRDICLSGGVTRLCKCKGET